MELGEKENRQKDSALERSTARNETLFYSQMSLSSENKWYEYSINTRKTIVN